MRIPSVLIALSLFCAPAFAAGPVTAPHTVPMVVANIQAMKINDVIQMKVKNTKTFEAAGIEALGAGDDVELRKIATDKVPLSFTGTDGARENLTTADGMMNFMYQF